MPKEAVRESDQGPGSTAEDPSTDTAQAVEASARASDDLEQGYFLALKKTIDELAKWTDPVSEKSFLATFIEYEHRAGRTATALQLLNKVLGDICVSLACVLILVS